MRIKVLFSIAIACSAIFSFIACDDKVSTVGGGIQPGGDDINVNADTVTLTANTYSLNDSLYYGFNLGLLGSIEDKTFGSLKADYLTEFYCPEKLTFHPKLYSIDSSFIKISTYNSSFLGDSISPIGFSAYEITTPLKADFFSDINPAEFCDMNKVLGRRFISYANTPIVTQASVKYRNIDIEVSKDFAKNIYTEWKADTTVFANSEELKRIFKGIYVTSNLGSKALVDVTGTSYTIYYSYYVRNKANTADSSLVGALTLQATPEVLQVNSIRNKGIENILNNDANPGKAYIKSPAGVATRVKIPLKQIAERAKEKAGDDYIINSASFNLKGFTEEEKNLTINKRPQNLLFINEDSIKNFFLHKRMADAKTSFIMNYAATTNTYNFSYENTSSTSNNVAKMINYYLKEFKNGEVKDLNYLVIPIDIVDAVQTSSGVYTYQSIANSTSAQTAILRIDEKNMRMALMFSKYNEIE